MTTENLRFGDHTLDLATGELRRGGTVVPLEPLPTRVLVILAARAGRLVTRAQLIDEAWPPGADVSDRSLNTCIREIRQALGDGADQPAFIETVPRRGYRFIAPVSNRDEGAPAGGRSRTGLGTVALAAGLALAVIGGTVLGVPAPVRVLVLPFVAIDSGPTSAVDASAMTEALMSRLARLPLDRVRVIGRTTAEHFAGSGLSAGAIGDSLDLDYVVEGTLHRGRGGTRMVVRIVRVADESLVWAQEFRGAGGADPGVIPSVLSRMAVLASVERSAALIAAAGAPPPDSVAAAAWRVVLKGRYLLRRFNEDDRASAGRYFGQAVALDSTLAAGHAGLAEVALFDGRLSEARGHAEAALRRDSASAEAHTVRGLVAMVADWRWDDAAKHLDRAVALAPGDQRPLHARAFLSLATGKVASATAALELVHQLDPMSAVVAADLGLAYYWAGRYDRAVEYCGEAAELEPNAAWSHACVFRASLLMGDAARAAAAGTALARLVDSTRPLALNASSPGALRRDYARWYLGGNYSSEDFHSAALAYADLGLVDSAVTALSAAAERRELPLVMLAVEPRTRPLRDDPAFRRLLHSMGLADVRPAGAGRETS